MLINVAIAFRLKAKISIVKNEENLEPYIFGGRIAADGDAPWQVFIQNSETGVPRCGGSILNEQWVVSSVSCVNETRYELL